MFRSRVLLRPMTFLAYLALLALAPGAVHATTQSISVGPGTLSWTVTTSTTQCSQTSYFTQWQFSAFTFTSGGVTDSLNGSASYFQSNCPQPPTGPQPSSLTLNGPSYVITFTPQSGGSGSATYTADQTYTVYPAYKVLGITYLPPGNQSSVSYSTDVTEGTTTSILDSFGSGTMVTVHIESGFLWKSTWDFNYSTSTTQGSTTTYTETIDCTTQANYLSFSDPLSHTSDRVFLWLNPAVTLIAQGGSSYGYTVFPKDTGTDGSPVMNTCNATIGQLLNPKTLTVGQLVSQTIDGVTVPGLLNLCQNPLPDNQCTTAQAASNGCGCTASDFAGIVQVDPFFAPNVPQNATPTQVNAVLPNRLVYLQTDHLQNGQVPSEKLTDAAMSANNYSTTLKETVGWTRGFSINFPPVFSLHWSNTKTHTWTDSMSSGKTNGIAHVENVIYGSNNPTCSEPVDVYLDTVFHTYVFVEDIPGACP